MPIATLRILVLLCILPQAAFSQETTALPADIETVVSGGDWESGAEARGHFRAVIATGGFEHIISDLTVEWIADPTDSDQPPRTYSSRAVPEVAQGGVHLTLPVIAREGGHWILTLEAENTHCDPIRVERWRLRLDSPGQITVLGSTIVQPGCN